MEQMDSYLPETSTAKLKVDNSSSSSCCCCCCLPTKSLNIEEPSQQTGRWHRERFLVSSSVNNSKNHYCANITRTRHNNCSFVSNSGSCCVSNLLTSCKNIKKCHTSCHHLYLRPKISQSNGFITRQNSSLQTTILKTNQQFLPNTINLFTILLFVFIFASHQFLLIPVTSSSFLVEALTTTSTTTTDLHLSSLSNLDLHPSSHFGLRRNAPTSIDIGSSPLLRNGLQSSDYSKSKFRYELTPSAAGRSLKQLSSSSSSSGSGNQDVSGDGFMSSKHDKENNGRLVLIHNQLSELRKQLELELLADRHQVTLGSPCTNATDCSNSIARSHCKLDNFTCACLPHHVEYNSTTCLPPSLLGYECLIDAQCQRKVPGSYCSSAGLCTCHSKFVTYRKDKCLPASKINDYCLNDSQCQLADRHSHCKWKIYNIYGLCKCPPNYKLVTVQSSNNNSTSLDQKDVTGSGNGTIKCAPRLGDSCFDSEECKLATENSICREPKSSDRLITSWRSSEATSRRCYCAQGFSESSNKLECQPGFESTGSTATISLLSETGSSSSIRSTGEGGTTTAASVLALSAPNSMNAKHHYDFVIPANNTETNHSQEFEIRPVDLLPSSTNQISISSSTTTTTTTTTQKPKPTRKPVQQQQQMVTTSSSSSPLPVTTKHQATTAVRVSSLGKPCSSRLECQARDKHSDCVNGLCECIRPTSRCSANATGCHKDTFQCRNGQCISWYFVCDQFKNCDDGSDEDECQTHRCPPEAFQCSDGACLARGKLCNGKLDCADGSDEQHCSSSLKVAAQNSTSTSTSPLTLNSTLMSTATATTTTSFSNASGCHPRAFACDNGQCLPAYVFCNAVEDCADGSDENERICERVWPKRKWQPITASSSSGNTTTTTTRNPPSSQQKSNGSNKTTPVQENKLRFNQPLDSPLVRSDRLSMEKLLAASLAARTPEGRGSRLLERQQPPASSSFGQKLAASDIRRRRNSEQQQQHNRNQCPKTAFTCRNGKCRSSAILCSGVDGCGDNSDEDRCEVCQCAAP